MALVYDVQALLVRVGVPVRDYLPVVEAIYNPLRQEFDRDLAAYSERLTTQADDMILQVNARGTIDDAALADIHAIMVSRDAAIKEAVRTLDARRWVQCTNVLTLLQRAAVCAYGRDAQGVDEVIRESTYGHEEGMSYGPRAPWDAVVYAMLMRLYEFASA